MALLEEMTCKVVCQDLIYQFATYRDYPEKISYDSIFTDDAQLIGPDSVREGAELRAGLESGPDFPYSIVHIFTNVVITPSNSNSARGSAYLVEYRVRKSPDEPLPRKISPTPRLVGDRLFEFRDTAAGWRISRYEMVPVLSSD